ncbi:hypothetical protein SAMN05444368_0801 [Acetomicrobium flavidum]|uniref:Transmembrane protein n=1 Tax=Acetomicrobium flavidum TaxID=49896 RepID=A0ABY1JCE0_9BACT|nr:hypothetical protein SAMN05444368_0801 [Acetomicrobium flavidum]
MERRLLRIRRWIDRSLEAWRRGNPRDVIVELECAEAEMRIAKDEILSLAVSGSTPRRRNISQLLSSLFVAAIFLMAVALPVSMDSFNGQNEANVIAKGESSSLHMSLITDDEERFILALRKSLSDTNVARAYELSKARGEGQIIKGPSSRTSKPTSSSNVIKNEQKDLREHGHRDVSFEETMLEDFLKLVQRGEKALRDQSGTAVEFSN